MTEAPTADTQSGFVNQTPTPDTPSSFINIDHANKIKEDNFKMAIDYYSEDNPFRKVIIGSTVGVVSSFSTSIIALGLSGAYISGGILFYDTALLVGGYAAIGAAAGLIIAVPAILGGIGYGIYKVVKTKKLKNYMGKISNINDESAAEEREILSKLTMECINYYKIFIKDAFTRKLKDLIEKDTLEILKLIKSKLKNSNDDIKDRIIKEINDMNFYNIILIGNTGVGKSTLINGFLQLKNNISQEGNTAEPQRIDNWPKKYPISEKDSDIVGINLYDTEGIEKTGENDFKNHLDRIVDFIHSPQTNLKDKINAIWYCINNNRLDGDEEYIKKIFNLFSGLKIPIIFIFTKAFSSREDDIYMIKEGLSKFEYFKEHPNDFHFIEVITKDLVSRKTGKVIEKKKGLDELLQETMKVSLNTIMAPIMKKISELFNGYSMKILEKLSKKLKEQYDDIITKHDKLKTFGKKFYDIFETIYGSLDISTKNSLENKISGWMKKIEEIEKNELKKAIKNYDKKYLMNRLEDFIKTKYDEKKKKYENLPIDHQFKQDYKEFKENINDYLITQINNSTSIYGLYSLFDSVRDSIFSPIFKDLEMELNRNKIDTQVELQKTIIPQKTEELKKKIMKKVYSINNLIILK